MLLRYGRSSPNLLEDLERWVDVLQKVANAQHGVQAMAAFLRYTLRVGQVPPKALQHFADQLGPRAQEAFMTGAEILTQEGYVRGKAEGEAKGKAEGEAKGKAEGEAKGKAELVLRLINVRFGSPTASVAERISNATPRELDTWAERILSCATLDDVFS